MTIVAFGTVQDPNSSSGLPGLQVVVFASNTKQEVARTRTDSNGKFRVEIRQPQFQTLSIDQLKKAFSYRILRDNQSLSAGEVRFDARIEIDTPDEIEGESGRNPFDFAREPGLRLPPQARPVIRTTSSMWYSLQIYSSQCSDCLNGIRICIDSEAAAMPSVELCFPFS